MICKCCNKRFGIENVNYWSCKLGICNMCIAELRQSIIEINYTLKQIESSELY